jgi:hypothetical protein
MSVIQRRVEERRFSGALRLNLFLRAAALAAPQKRFLVESGFSRQQSFAT